MEETRGITVKVALALHTQAKADQEARRMTMSEYITMVLEEHFNPNHKMKGGDDMKKDTRTMAFQIDEVLFQRIKDYLHRTGLSQKSFVVGLIEHALSEAEAGLEGIAPQSNNDTGDGPDITG